jgi:hypothetical protein
LFYRVFHKCTLIFLILLYIFFYTDCLFVLLKDSQLCRKIAYIANVYMFFMKPTINKDYLILSEQVKLEHCHLTYTVSVWCKNQSNSKIVPYKCTSLCWHSFIASVLTFLPFIQPFWHLTKFSSQEVNNINIWLPWPNKPVKEIILLFIKSFPRCLARGFSYTTTQKERPIKKMKITL